MSSGQVFYSIDDLIEDRSTQFYALGGQVCSGLTLSPRLNPLVVRCRFSFQGMVLLKFQLDVWDVCQGLITWQNLNSKLCLSYSGQLLIFLFRSFSLPANVFLLSSLVFSHEYTIQKSAKNLRIAYVQIFGPPFLWLTTFVDFPLNF